MGASKQHVQTSTEPSRDHAPFEHTPTGARQQLSRESRCSPRPSASRIDDATQEEDAVRHLVPDEEHEWMIGNE
jgi:hypothetical protein